jgi:hypothetical protein
VHPTIDPETEFERELQIFGNDVDVAIQCFYVWLTVHEVARTNRKLYDLLNKDAGFWNVATGSIQANSLITLGRIFDTQRQSYNVRRLLKLGELNIAIFSKEALRKRKSRQSANALQWIDDYILDVYVPTASDFKRLQSFVDARRRVYGSCYKQLRDKVYAHKERTDVTGFVAKTNVRELGRLLSAMQHLYNVLWNLLQNGEKPRLRPVRHVGGRRITADTRKFLKSLVARAT